MLEKTMKNRILTTAITAAFAVPIAFTSVFAAEGSWSTESVQAPPIINLKSQMPTTGETDPRMASMNELFKGMQVTSEMDGMMKTTFNVKQQGDFVGDPGEADLFAALVRGIDNEPGIDEQALDLMTVFAGQRQMQQGDFVGDPGEADLFAVLVRGVGNERFAGWKTPDLMAAIDGHRVKQQGDFVVAPAEADLFAALIRDLVEDWGAQHGTLVQATLIDGTDAGGNVPVYEQHAASTYNTGFEGGAGYTTATQVPLSAWSKSLQALRLKDSLKLEGMLVGNQLLDYKN